MVLKDGVKLTGMQPQILLALFIADRIWLAAGTELTVTSVNDSKHMEGSLHYTGAAADLRIHDLPEEKWAGLRDALKARLGTGLYDVVLETDPPHIHVEYQPKP